MNGITKRFPWGKVIKKLSALVIHWMAFKNLGNNNGSLAEGVCRALDIKATNGK